VSGPEAGRVVASVRGDGVFVVTPCHGVRVFLPHEDALVGAQLSPVCPLDDRRWLLELVADEGAASGLRAVWTVPDQEETAR